jgi:insulysin
MSKILKYFDIDLPINDKRDIRGLTLTNGIKLVLISDKDIKISSCSIGIKAGYLEDEFEGTAHFLEHLLFMGSTKFPEQNTYHSYVQTCGGLDNAFTGDNITCYFLELENSFLEKGIEMLSWFFREPLLDMKHINSEREIINSEHQKNILSDPWIMDDIFKKFLNKSKYTNFGTGSSESLKDITKKDILNFYNKYYTTDNMYVCIVDSDNIKTMSEKYLKYFEDIPIKNYSEEKERYTKEKLSLIDKNLIVFKSISQYVFLNYYLVFTCDQHEQTVFQLANLFSHIIGSEYTNSFSYFLKENNFASYIKTNVDYYYDYEAIVTINITLNNENTDINKISVCLNTLLNKISKIEEDEFKLIYENYRKINLLESLYNNKPNSSELSNDVVDNLMKGDSCLCIIRKNMVPEYTNEIYLKFLNLAQDLEIKITTNVNVNNLAEDKFSISEHYKTKYNIEEYNISTTDAKIDFNFNNLIIFSNIPIKTEIIKSSVNKKELPRLIYKNNIREIYLLEHNKYEKPMLSISMIRKNNKFIEKENSLIITIYKNLCGKILNYYLDTISNYKMNYMIAINDGYLIYNFYGLDYVMKKFINEIINKTSFYALQINPNSPKYFNEIIKDIKENLLNLKYDSPYLLCLKYFSILLSKDYMPDDAINYLDSLTYEKFVEKLDKLLVFEKEIYLIVGNLKNCPDAFDCEDSTIANTMEYIEYLTLNSLRYESKKVIEESKDKKKYILDEDLNYILTKTQINPKEINNCLVDCYLVKKYDLILSNDSIDKKQLKIIFKDKTIYNLIANLINEPLFDKIRTIDKLGYIVKSTFKYHTIETDAKIFICYIIQSNYKMEDIYKSVDTFNKNFYSKFLSDKKEFEELFNNLKKSMILDLKKNPNDLDEEVSIYVSSIINKYGIFNYIDLNLEILKKITFDDLVEYLENLFTTVIKENRYHVILNKNSSI